MPGLAPPVADERTALLAFLSQQRQGLRVSTHGLTEEQARSAPCASELNIAGLIKHAGYCERGWMDLVLRRESAPRTPEESAVGEFHLGPEENLADLLVRYDRACAETDEVIASIADLGQAVPVPPNAEWIPAEIKEWSVRWVLLHLIEETARHAGHADIIRETIDGATHYPLLAAAEQWPDPWFQPWEPATATA